MRARLLHALVPAVLVAVASVVLVPEDASACHRRRGGCYVVYYPSCYYPTYYYPSYSCPPTVIYSQPYGHNHYPGGAYDPPSGAEPRTGGEPVGPPRKGGTDLPPPKKGGTDLPPPKKSGGDLPPPKKSGGDLPPPKKGTDVPPLKKQPIDPPDEPPQKKPVQPPAGSASPIFGPNEPVAGKTVRDWSAAFLQWAFSHPKDRSPILDKTGEFADEGQTAPVWFLGGNFGGVTKRKLTVPAGKPIFSTVLYSIGTGAEGVKKNMDAATDMEVTLNGKSLGDVSRWRAYTGSVTINAPGAADAVHPLIVGNKTMVADGYWFILRPLPPGDHTLRVKGRTQGGEFELDITYAIKVVQRKKT